ncbi:MAG: ABC transporter permease subunit [Lachnospiraceae bacterium]|nr:ABC transporter permease subunit [Lachnospiraceae bacterium]
MRTYFYTILEKRQVKTMLRYELKKIFVKPSGKIALLLLAGLLALVCFFATDVEFINEQGNPETGIEAVRKLRAVQKEWAGELTEEKLAAVIAENARINATPEGRSMNVQDSDIAFGWKQGIYDIRGVLNHAFGRFREYDYYLIDSMTPEDAGRFYGRRVLQLKEWLDGEAADQYSDKEKEFLIHQFEALETPFRYDYFKGWDQFMEYAPTVIMITVLILGFLSAGIFSGEFQLKADAVFFSSRHGRGRASAAKLGAGVIMVTVIYWVMMLLYSAVVLGYLGADGADCVFQFTGRGWKSFYNITIWQAYLLIIFGGYIGVLFMLLLVMLVSAKTKSAVLAVIVPFFLIFLPNFIADIPSAIVGQICGLLPDQLLQMNMAVCYFNLYEIGGKVMGAVPILLAVYLALSVVLGPVVWSVYRRAEVN